MLIPIIKYTKYKNIIISLVIIIIFIIFIIIINDKYNKYNNYNKENFENLDTKTSMDTSKDEIIITLSTSPKRLDKIKDTLDTMITQTTQPTSIYINVPTIFKRTGETYDDNKLEEIKKIDSRIQINRCEDKGPITKILSTLKLVSNPNTIIIIMDDDIKYNSKTVEILVNSLKQNPDKVNAGSIGSFFINDNINIVEGFSGICFYRKIFNDDFYKLIDDTNSYVHCYKSDDFIISHYLNKNNIKSIKVENIVVQPFEFGFQADALHKQDNIGHPERYSKCNTYINNNFSEIK